MNEAAITVGPWIDFGTPSPSTFRCRPTKRCPCSPRSTQIDVTYDLSALTAQGAAELDDFAAGYAQDIGAWEVAIETALAKKSGPKWQG